MLQGLFDVSRFQPETGIPLLTTIYGIRDCQFLISIPG